jgi:hypothetical protein
MTVRVNKSSFNIREKLSELGRKFGLKGSEVVAAETLQQIRDLISVGRRNKVINGAMQFSQRTTSESGLSSSNTVRVLDRFQIRINSTGTWTVSQSTESPPGFSNSMRWQCTTADASLGASDFMYMAHRFEGRDVQDLVKGTSSAKPVTVSFWVRSTVTGSYSFRLVDNQNNRQIGQNYTVNQADTWEHKTMTFAGDTTGALSSDGSNRLSMMWWLAVGSNRTSGAIPTSWETLTTADEAADQTANIASSTSNNFYITGIQLEVGSNATEFEHRSYGEELALCQRYYQKKRIGYGRVAHFRTDTILVFAADLPVELRGSAGSITQDSGLNNWAYRDGVSPTISSIQSNNSSASETTLQVLYSVSSGGDSDETCFYYGGGSILIDAEF